LQIESLFGNGQDSIRTVITALHERHNAWYGVGSQFVIEPHLEAHAEHRDRLIREEYMTRGRP
jgi:hypothetical protein